MNYLIYRIYLVQYYFKVFLEGNDQMVRYSSAFFGSHVNFYRKLNQTALWKVSLANICKVSNKLASYLDCANLQASKHVLDADSLPNRVCNALSSCNDRNTDLTTFLQNSQISISYIQISNCRVLWKLNLLKVVYLYLLESQYSICIQFTISVLILMTNCYCKMKTVNKWIFWKANYVYDCYLGF